MGEEPKAVSENARILRTHLTATTIELILLFGDVTDTIGEKTQNAIVDTPMASTIKALLRVTDRKAWEDVAGAYVQIRHNKHHVYAVGNLLDKHNLWFQLKVYCNEDHSET